MMMLSYEEQSILKMFGFKTKEELKKKLNKSLKNVEDEDVKEIVKGLLGKIDCFTVEELKDLDSLFE